jgi:Ca-activated chloride channel family protein
VNALLEHFHLLRPWALLLLVPALALWWTGHQAADTTRRWAHVIDPELLRLLLVGGKGPRRPRPHDLLLAGGIVATLAIAGPTWRHEPSPFADSRAPVMIVLRVASSMMTPDLAPTRLDRARQKIADLLKANDGMPAGLIAYSGSAHLVLPPTQDREVVIDMAQALAPAIMPREGDRLADAVALAAQLLREDGKGGAILVIADTGAPGQADALRAAGAPDRPPVVLLAMAPSQAVEADTTLATAVSALAAPLIETTLDNADIRTISRRLESDADSATIPGGAARWQEAGFWLTPLIALLVLLWFRRGWVIST